MNRRVAGGLAGTLLVVISIFTAMVGGAAPTVAAAPSVREQGHPTVSGAGSSFLNLELAQWRASIARPPYGLSINYAPGGSTLGRNQYLDGLVDFGGSDIEFQPEEQAKVESSPRKNFVYVPVAAGALGFMFNLVGTNGARITDLKLTQNDVCRMFTEEMVWNDPSIVAANPGAPLPAEPIRPIVRSDGAGTTYVLSEYCIANAPDVWRRFVGRVLADPQAADSADVSFRTGRPSSVWPRLGFLGAAYASDGLANTVASPTAGRSAVTYLEAGYSVKLGLPTAQVRNGAGVFVPPNPPNSTVALGYATPLPNGTFRLQYNGPDPRAYFPSTYSYVIAQTAGFDPNKGRVLATFLYYAVTIGQRSAEPLLYSRLSTVLVLLALEKASQIPGAPPIPTDLAGAPPPPEVLGAPPGSLGAGGGGGGGGGPAAAATGGPGAGSDDPAAAAAAAAAAASAAEQGAAAVQTDDGYSLGLSKKEQEALAEKSASEQTRISSAPDRPLGEVMAYLLAGFALVGLATFFARGVVSPTGAAPWRRR